MTLSERLDEAPKRTAGLPCSVGALEDKLDGKEADALHAMLHTLGWSGTRVHQTLAEEGYVVGQQTVNRHRSRSCRCFQ